MMKESDDDSSSEERPLTLPSKLHSLQGQKMQRESSTTAPLTHQTLSNMQRNGGARQVEEYSPEPSTATAARGYRRMSQNRQSFSDSNQYLQQLQQLQQPLLHRLFSSHYVLVTNPGNSDQHHSITQSTSSLHLSQPSTRHSISDAEQGTEDEESQHRASILNNMRPVKLIGSYKPVATWLDLHHDTKNIKDKKLRKFYDNQNALLERFQEIDNFLDAGKIHFNMLSNYQANSDQAALKANGKLNGNSNSLDPTEPLLGSNLVQNDSYNSINSKTSRHNVVPGDVENEGAQFLGYNHEEDSQDVLIAILVNFFINFILLIGKLIVTIMTNSMSVVASLVDSLLDFLSTFIIYIANRLSNTKSWKSEHAYPVGRSRLEPLGILVFSIIIIILFVQVGQESFKRLIFSTPESRIPVQIGFSAMAIMILTIGSKIGCWIWCSLSKSSSVQALAQDAMTDIVFNTVSLLMPTIGYYFDIWWLDSAGALVLSIYIVISWSMTGFEHIDNLTGAVADPLDYQVILYLAYRFAESIKQITALKVYHVGDNLNVEIDLVFADEEFDLSIRDCHDIAEALQYAIETLPMVERAFVHIDYMEGNFKGHLH